MGIPYRFDPLGTLGAGGWPRALLPGLLDGWLMRAPERTAKGLAVTPPGTTTGDGANTYSIADMEFPCALKTLLFCSMASFTPAGLYNPLCFCKKNTDGVDWGVYFYGITNLPPHNPLAIGEGIIIDTPRRYQNKNFRVATPFDAVVTYNGASWRVYEPRLGWSDVPVATGSYRVTNASWRYCAAWAAYDSVLSDSEAVHRLELLRQFANG